MSGALAVAAWEIRQRRILLPVALNIGLLPFVVDWVVSLLGRLGGRFPSDVVFGLALLIPSFSSAAFAIGLGFSVIGRDLGETRLGSRFAKPPSGPAIWGGRVLAALALTFGTIVLVTLPVALLAVNHHGFRPGSMFLLAFTHFGIAVLIALMSVGALAAGVLRSRSRLAVGMDIVGVAVVVGVFAAVWRWMSYAGAEWLARDIAIYLVFPVAAVLLAATAAQTLIGHMPPRRGQVVLSSVILIGLLSCALGFALYGRWVTSATLDDLRAIPIPEQVPTVHVTAPTSGDWVTLSGGTRRTHPPDLYTAGFLMNASTGDYRKLGCVQWGEIVWSADGGRVAWSVQGPRHSDIMSARVGSVGMPIVRVTSERVKGGGAHDRPFALSPEGRLLVARESDETMRMIDVERGREIARVGSGSRALTGLFLPDGRVRLLAVQTRGNVLDWRVSDWDGRSDRLVERAALSTDLEGEVSFSPEAERLLVTEPEARRVSLYVLDRRQLTPLIDAWTGVAGFLSESRIFAVDKNNDPGLRLRLFGADGTPRATVAIPGRFPIRFGGEPVPGLLSIGIGSNREGPRGTLFIDAATGEVKRRELGVLPARGWGWKLAPAPGSAGTRLFWDAQGRLVRLDPGTGERHVLVATRGPDDRE